MAKEFLSQRGVPYVEKDVSRDRAAAIEMVRATQQQGVPVLKIDNQYVVGFDRPRIEALLRARPAAATTGAARTPARPSLGLSVADAANHTPAGSPPGAYVGQVTPGMPGAQAGIRVGDVITLLAGRPIYNADDLTRQMALLRPGQAFEAEIARNGARLRVTVRL